MCESCWHEVGAPTELPEGFEKIVELLNLVYDEADDFVSGPMHLQLEDWNLEDDFFNGPLEPVEFSPGDAMEPSPLRVELYEAMKPLTEKQRYAVMALQRGFLTVA